MIQIALLVAMKAQVESPRERRQLVRLILPHLSLLRPATAQKPFSRRCRSSPCNASVNQLDMPVSFFDNRNRDKLLQLKFLTNNRNGQIELTRGREGPRR